MNKEREKKFNDWYERSTDRVIKDRIKSIDSKNLACVIVCIIVTMSLFVGFGYFEYRHTIDKMALTETWKMMGFMSGALDYCATQSNSTSKEMMIAYGRNYVDESFKKMEQTSEECKDGCDNNGGLITNAKWAGDAHGN